MCLPCALKSVEVGELHPEPELMRNWTTLTWERGTHCPWVLLLGTSFLTAPCWGVPELDALRPLCPCLLFLY